MWAPGAARLRIEVRADASSFVRFCTALLSPSCLSVALFVADVADDRLVLSLWFVGGRLVVLLGLLLLVVAFVACGEVMMMTIKVLDVA